LTGFAICVARLVDCAIDLRLQFNVGLHMDILAIGATS